MTDHTPQLDAVSPTRRVRITTREERLANRAVALLLATGFLLLLLGGFVAFYQKESLEKSILLMITGLVLVGAGLVGIFEGEKRAEERLKRKISQTLTDTSSSDYFEKLVNINVENLSAYYITVKGHANKSFLTALFVGVVGFVLIGIGIYSSVTHPERAPSIATLSGVSGVATEFISAIFFYLYNQTVKQMKEYHDSLLAVQNILLSFKLVGDTTDPKDKATMIGVMLEYLVGKRPVETTKITLPS
jgi:uncharacterized membrane protein